MTPELQARIDALGHVEMARLWRFAETGHEMLQGEAGAYFKQRLFDHYGGIPPGISKLIGWGS